MKRFKLIMRIAAAATAAVAWVPCAEAQVPFPDFGQRFTQYSGNPLLSLESSNPWNFGPGDPYEAIPGTIHPDVLYFPQGMDGYKFWMIFTPYEGWKWGNACGEGVFDPSECPPPPWTHVLAYWERLTLVRSNDGINWSAAGVPKNPIVSPDTPDMPCTWNTGVHYDPDFVYAPGKGPNGESWFAYFAVANTCGLPSSIGLALSSNGVEYKIYGPVMPEVAAATPSVVYDPAAAGGQGLFYGWYLHDFGTGGKIGFATSPNGINWTPVWTPACPSLQACWQNGVLQPDPLFCEWGLSHEDVIKFGNEFWMYYHAQPSGNYHDLFIRRAVSTDGINWTKDARPILTKYTGHGGMAACETTNVMPTAWVYWDRTGPAASPTPVSFFYRPTAAVVGNAMYLYFGGVNKVTYNTNPSDRDTGLAFSSRFNDVPPIHWAYEAVEELAVQGIVGGCGNNNFCPDATATRRELALLIAVAGGLTPQHPQHNYYFCDVPNDGFAPRINAVYEQGIMGDCGGCGPFDPRRSFCPLAQIDRLEMGLAFYEALNLAPGVPPFHFIDVNSPDHVKIDALYEAGLVGGCQEYPVPLYCPDAGASRAMLAVLTAAAY
jgi:hypothetical protein